MDPRITGSDRDIARPKNWVSSQPGMAWHHVIPYCMLRDVWNGLVSQQITTSLPEAPVAVRQYLLLTDRNLEGVDELVDRMRAENRDQRRAGHHKLQPLDEVEVHRLATTAVWPAWNIVEGPRSRADDPAHEYLDRFTSGLTLEENVRMKAVEVLYRQFETFLEAGPQPGPNALGELSDHITAARRVVTCDEPIPYRPEMWVQDESGLWRKRRDGELYKAAGA